MTRHPTTSDTHDGIGRFENSVRAFFAPDIGTARRVRYWKAACLPGG